MTKWIAALLAAVIMICVCSAAFATTHGVMTWNEEEKCYEFEIIDDGEDEEYFNPRMQENIQNGEGLDDDAWERAMEHMRNMQNDNNATSRPVSKAPDPSNPYWW